MNNINKIVKLANFYSYAVSSVSDILGTGRTINTICESVNDFLKNNKDVNKVEFKIQVGKMAQDKFNQLIAPYLQLNPVDIGLKNLEQRLKQDVNQDDLEFFIHDLVHEILEPKSIEKFKKLDEQFSEEQNKILKEMQESDDLKGDGRFWSEDDDGNIVFNPMGVEYRSGGYSLEDLIDEQVAEALTSATKITKNGLYKYINMTMIGLANKYFNFHWSQEEYSFEEYVDNQYKIHIYLEEVISKIAKDCSEIKNPKYKKIAEKFLHSAKNWIYEIEQYVNSEFEKSKYDVEIYFNKIINPILSKTKDWIGSNFNLKQSKILRENEFEHNPMGEKQIFDLTDDFKMSFLRRWLLSVDGEVKSMMLKENNRPGKQLKLNF